MLAVRQARPADAKAAVDLVRRSITELCGDDHHGDAATLDKWLSNKTVQHFLSWFADEKNFCVVAESGDTLLGIGLLQRNGEIVLLYLDPPALRRGVGSAIHRALEDRARSWEIAELKLDSTANARPFYEKLGYRAAGEPRPRFGVLRSYPYLKVLRAAQRRA